MFSFSSYFAFNIWLELPISAVNFGFFGVKIGEGIFGFRPQPNQFFLFGPQRFLPNFVKIAWKMRPYRRVHRQTDTQQLIWLSVPCYGIAMGQIKYPKSTWHDFCHSERYFTLLAYLILITGVQNTNRQLKCHYHNSSNYKTLVTLKSMALKLFINKAILRKLLCPQPVTYLMGYTFTFAVASRGFPPISVWLH